MIKLVNVSKIYNNNGVLTTGLHNVSLEFQKGEIVAIVGESGSGKSTLLNVLTKIDTFDEGEYYYKGNETSYFDIKDMDDFRKNKIGFIFQNYNILDSYTVLENVMLPLLIKGMKRRDAKKRAIEIIKKVGLYPRIKNRGTNLSGGEKQRCVIARALAADCDILACDEPTGNLDSNTSKDIINLIKEVADDKLVFIVTHNFEQVKDICTRKIVIHDSEVIEDTVYREFEKDKEEELNLDYQPLKRRVKYSVACSNLVNTPKKTILSSLVLLFLSIFAIVFLNAAYYISYHLEYNNLFNYFGSNKLIAYNVNGTRLDLDKIKNVSSNYIVNEFYCNDRLGVAADSNALIGENQYGYEKNPANLKLTAGRMPKTEYECVALLDYHVSNFKEEHFRINVSNETKKFTIVGYQLRDDIAYPMLTRCDLFGNLLKAKWFNRMVKQYKYEVDNLFNFAGITSIYNPSLEKSYFDLATEAEGKKLELLPLKYEKYTFDWSTESFEVRYTGQDALFYGNDLLEKFSNDNPYEVSIYANKTSRAKKILKEYGYSAMDVRTFSSNDMPLINVFLNITSYFIIAFSILAIMVVYFISYVVMAKVYGTKKKDYTVIRTLGVSKKDMKTVVTTEVMVQALITTLFTLMVAAILGSVYPSGFFVIFNHMSFTVIVFYFILMFVFGLLLSRRFNRRLFKFSVNKTLKNGEAKND